MKQEIPKEDNVVFALFKMNKKNLSATTTCIRQLREHPVQYPVFEGTLIVEQNYQSGIQPY